MAAKASGTFAALGLMTSLCENLGKIRISKPTSVQLAAIPSLLSTEKHHLIVAEPGKGKTLAYLLPVLHTLKEAAIRTKGVRIGVTSPPALLVVRTEKQAKNIEFLLKAIAQGMGVRGAALKTGETVAEIGRRVGDGVDLLIATPELSALPDLSLKFTHNFIIDDADQTLDPIESIVTAALGTSRVVLSTANPGKIGRFLRDNFTGTQRELVKVETGSGYKDLAGIKHSYIPTSEETRTADFLSVMISRRKLITQGKALVFCPSLQRVKEIEQLLRENDFTAVAVHSDLSTKTKERNLWKVKRSLCKVLVTSDISAREVEVPEVKLVASVDFPQSAADYAFRAGFAVQSGGTFLCLTTAADQRQLSEYTRVLSLAPQKPASPPPAISHATN